MPEPTDTKYVKYLRIQSDRLTSLKRVRTARRFIAMVRPRVEQAQGTLSAAEYQQQLLEMLSLDPVPEKTPLQATITGTPQSFSIAYWPAMPA
jgi:hypothetical protein